MDLNKIIQEYIEENLSIGIEEISTTSKRYTTISEVLTGITFQSGSYARKTAIKPLNDLDMINILGITSLSEYKPGLLDQVHRLLSIQENKDKIGYHHLKRQSRSIGVYFHVDESKFSIDIVPAIPTQSTDRYHETIYQIPETQKMNKKKRRAFEEKISSQGGEIGWKLSTPKGYIAYAKKLDESTHNTFRMATRFVKSRKKSYKENYVTEFPQREFPIKSFHLELIVAELVEIGYGNLSQLLSTVFDKLYSYFDGDPHFVDLAYEQEEIKEHIDAYIDKDVDTPFLTDLVKELQRVNTLLGKINSASSDDEVYGIIESILTIGHRSTHNKMKQQPAFSTQGVSPNKPRVSF